MGIESPSISSLTRDAIGAYDVSGHRKAEQEKKSHWVGDERAFAKRGGKPGMWGCEGGFAGKR